MKQNFGIRLLAIALSINLAFSNSMLVLAEENSIDTASEPITEMIVEPTEEPTLEPALEPEEDGTVEATLEPEEDSTMEPTQEPSEDPTMEPVLEPTNEPSAEPVFESEEDSTATPILETEETSTEPTSEPVQEPTALPSDEPSEEPVKEELLFQLSDKEVQLKKQLRESLPLIQSLTEGEDFVSGEVFVYAESEELANRYADALQGSIIDYMGNYALITLSGSAKETIVLSADAESLLPAAWPNYISSVENSDVSEAQNANTAEEQMTADDFGEAKVSVSDDLQGLGYISSDLFLKYEWHHDMLESEIVWDQGYRGNGTTVAILSTGHDINNTDVYPDTYGIGLGTNDGNGRGTAYASVIAGDHNGAEYSGIAPDSDLISIKIADDKGKSSASNAWQGLMRAIQLGADIVCMDYTSIGPVPNIEEALEMAYENGITVFVTVGDNGNNCKYYPAAYTHAYGVAAVNPDKSRMYCSNYGGAVRYAAPGGEVDAIGKGSGFSTAIVSAQAAVLLSSGKVTGEGSARVDKLISLMDKSCMEAKGSGLGKGIVRMHKALNIVNPLQKPKAPKFVDKAGTYKKSSKVIKLTSEPGTYIYYTTNGKDVNKNGIPASGAMYYEPEEGIHINSSSVTIKAIAVNKYNNQISEQSVATYQLKPPVENVYIRSLSGAYEVMLLKKENKLQLKAEIYPEIAVGKTVTWSVVGSPKGISVNEKGLVTVKKTANPGTYTIKAKTKNGKTGTCDITVSLPANERIASMTADVKTYYLKTNEEKDAPLVITMADGSTKLPWFADVYARSSDKSIVEVRKDPYKEAVELTAGYKPGKAIVTVYAQDGSGLKLQLTVHVKAPVSSISIRGKDRVLRGKSIQLKKSIYPSNASNKKVKWSVSPAGKGVKVDTTGKVTVSKTAPYGVYTISCKAQDGSGVAGQKTILVTNDKVKSINISKSSITVFNNSGYESVEGERVPVSIVGGDRSSWEAVSSNPYVSVTEYDDYIYIVGNHTKPCKATITVKSTDGTGIKDTITVNVINKPSGIKISLPSGRCAEVAKGKTLQLKAVLGDDNGVLCSKNKKFKWSSSDPEIMKVDKNTGKVTCLKEEGTATIRVQTTDGSYLDDEITLTAIKAATSVYLAQRTVNEEKIPNTFSVTAGSLNDYRICQKHADGMIYRGRHEMKFTVDKQGLYAEMSKDGFDVRIVGTKKGTYKLTMTCSDGSSAKKVYTVKVK